MSIQFSNVSNGGLYTRARSGGTVALTENDTGYLITDSDSVVDLPIPSKDGLVFHVKNNESATGNLVTAGGGTVVIEGDSEYSLPDALDGAFFQSIGGEYWAIAQKSAAGTGNLTGTLTPATFPVANSATELTDGFIRSDGLSRYIAMGDDYGAFDTGLLVSSSNPGGGWGITARNVDNTGDGSDAYLQADAEGDFDIRAALILQTQSGYKRIANHYPDNALEFYDDIHATNFLVFNPYNHAYFGDQSDYSSGDDDTVLNVGWGRPGASVTCVVENTDTVNSSSNAAFIVKVNPDLVNIASIGVGAGSDLFAWSYNLGEDPARRFSLYNSFVGDDMIGVAEDGTTSFFYPVSFINTEFNFEDHDGGAASGIADFTNGPWTGTLAPEWITVSKNGIPGIIPWFALPS